LPFWGFFVREGRGERAVSVISNVPTFGCANENHQAWIGFTSTATVVAVFESSITSGLAPGANSTGMLESPPVEALPR
jgi:hypothetical protein